MGRGNTIIRSADGESVETYYFETPEFEATKKNMIEHERDEMRCEVRGLRFDEIRNRLRQMIEDNEWPPNPCDELVYDDMQLSLDDEIDNLRYELAELEQFEKEDDAWRDDGRIIARGVRSNVVIADNECRIAVGVVPNFDEDDIQDHAEAIEFRDAAIDSLTDALKNGEIEEILVGDIMDKQESLAGIERENYRALLTAEYLAEANAAMAKIHAYFGSQSIYVRTSAWTSAKLAPYDAENKIEYYK